MQTRKLDTGTRLLLIGALALGCTLSCGGTDDGAPDASAGVAGDTGSGATSRESGATQPDAGPGTCSHVTCPDGCCLDGVCRQGATVATCGVSGAACESCTDGKDCFAGACVAKASCDNCKGCCLDGTQCMPGSAPTACGTAGAACVKCEEGHSCVNGTCQALECDKSNCDGCCTANNQCMPFAQQTKAGCGKGGQACEVCATADKSCTQGTCVKDQPCLSFCTQGCCTAQGQCIGFTDQDETECGVADQCKSCGALSCISGKCVSDPAWEVWIESATVTAKSPQGDDWDQTLFANPLPDPYAIFSLGDAAVLAGTTKTIDNTLTPFWNEKVKVYAQSDLTSKGLKLGVRDADGLGVFETMGTCAVFKPTAATLASGGHTIATCGASVTNLKLKFVKQ